MNTWIGTSGYQYPQWKGSFYPEDLSTAKMLGYYAARFPTTESNYSFRHMPSEKTIANWARSTPPEFRFSLKAPQRITHFARLRDCSETVEAFYRIVAGLGEKLGAVLFQLPPTLQKDAALLRDFVKALSPAVRAAFEFRHVSWFDEGIYGILRERNAALCLAEDDELATPPVVTANFGYLRLRRADYRPAALKRWAAMVREQAGWSDAFIYFKHEETGTGPKFGAKMQKLLKR